MAAEARGRASDRRKITLGRPRPSTLWVPVRCNDLLGAGHSTGSYGSNTHGVFGVASAASSFLMKDAS